MIIVNIACLQAVCRCYAEFAITGVILDTRENRSGTSDKEREKNRLPEIHLAQTSEAVFSFKFVRFIHDAVETWARIYKLVGECKYIFISLK